MPDDNRFAELSTGLVKLRCFAQDRPKQWTSWLPWAEYWYNTTWHASIQMTPFEAVYGLPPPRLLSYIPGTTTIAAVDEVLRSCAQILVLLQQNLRLQPYRQTSITAHRALKLAPRFYGPFRVVRRVGEVAYELDLPPEARIHPVFHVSQLKPKLGSSVLPIPTLPPVDPHGIIQPEPQEVLGRRSRKANNRSVTDLLIRWARQSADDATWEEFYTLTKAYPHLVGKVF